MNLIEELIANQTIKNLLVVGAFRAVRRRDFLRAQDKEAEDFDAPVSIGYGQTNSQPATVAFMLEALDPGPGMKILDVGCGSGWTSALLARIVGRSGRVIGLEIIPELADFARENIMKYPEFADGRMDIICADGYQGWRAEAPYDRILVSAAAPQIPEDLLGQLKEGGRMVIPVGRENESQTMTVIDKDISGRITKTETPGFIFVPLVKKQ